MTFLGGGGGAALKFNLNRNRNLNGCIRAKIWKLTVVGLHLKHAEQRGIWVPTEHLLWDEGKPRTPFIELACYGDSFTVLYVDDVHTS
jgi:hypothetical protein